jgi:uncharacterized protein
VITPEIFNEATTLQKLKHYLPSQGPLKDFVHHNTLHGFQHFKFDAACHLASSVFGYKVSLTINEYRQLYKQHRIREDVLEDRILKKVGVAEADEWIHKLFHGEYDESTPSRIGNLRSEWKKKYDIDLDAEVHKNLFKLLNSYLDQGISIWKFPVTDDGFLASLRELEKCSFAGFLRTPRAKNFLNDPATTIADLLKVLIGDERLYELYLFDQQFAHPGWSGLVVYVEQKPESLLDKRIISLRDVIILDLILEIDALDNRFGDKWMPLGSVITERPTGIFEPVPKSEKNEVIAIWQEAYEWSYYDQVLTGIQKMENKPEVKKEISFQALFCIDDREGSIRRHIENLDKKCETYGTPGHFGIEFYYQPERGQFHTKVCPAPLKPKYLIKEKSAEFHLVHDIHFSKYTHHPVFGAFFSLTVGFFSAFRLFINIFKPSKSPAASSSFSHMGKKSYLTIENKSPDDKQDGLQIGFTLDEMAERVENVLKAIGLVENYSNLVYVIGHGASSINNTHYAGYDCGACSGRPGSVNARVFCYMANHPEVRKRLREKEDVFIPDRTQFIGGLHDTTRDEFIFYDEDSLTVSNQELHKKNLEIFRHALDMNAKERSRRFFSVDSRQSPEKIHQEIRNRSVSLFEPRPELNHATNALCIVGRHSLHEGLFLDRRAFSNSYDYRYDSGGRLLLNILNAATAVCGGINLEYYFSRVDNQKLGAGSKLPHNVMGLIGVANGIEGDLRPGLPYQMIDIHDPLRLMMIVEHYPQVVLKVIKKNPATYEWYENEWVHLAVIHPDTSEILIFKDGAFTPYHTLKHLLDTVTDVNSLIESGDENFPVYLIKK